MLPRGLGLSYHCSAQKDQEACSSRAWSYTTCTVPPLPCWPHPVAARLPQLLPRGSGRCWMLHLTFNPILHVRAMKYKGSSWAAWKLLDQKIKAELTPAGGVLLLTSRGQDFRACAPALLSPPGSSSHSSTSGTKSSQFPSDRAF